MQSQIVYMNMTHSYFSLVETSEVGELGCPFICPKTSKESPHIVVREIRNRKHRYVKLREFGLE